MSNAAMLEIARMQNSFAQTHADPDMTKATYKLVLQGLSSQAVIEAAQRFVMGDVQGQSKTFAPSIAEFVAEARQRQEYIDIKALPRLPPPSFYHHTGSPFYVRQEKIRTKYRECAILAENIGLDEYRKRCMANEFAEGHAWIAAVATVFGPPAMEIATRS